MPIPETTSAEAFARYVGGKCLLASRGKAWRDIKAWIVAPPRIVDILHLPSVSEPFLAWTISGEVEFQEREDKQPWITHLIKKESFFLTSGGAPYDCRWKTVTSEPFGRLQPLGLPPVGRATRGHALLTKTLLIVGQEGNTQRVDGGEPGSVMAVDFEIHDPKLCAYDKATGKVVGEVALPRNATGAPITNSSSSSPPAAPTCQRNLSRCACPDTQPSFRAFRIQLKQ
jgi:hypothetical protein